MKFVYIITNGCIEGQLYSKTVKQFFKIHNWSITKNLIKADIVIFYACGLTKSDEECSFEIIKKLKTNMKPEAELIVWGCLPKQNPQTLATYYNGYLIGAKDINFFELLLEKTITSIKNIEQVIATHELESVKKIQQDKIKQFSKTIIFLKYAWDKFYSMKFNRTDPYYIRVATGCEGHCTYCSEHTVFGKTKSRSINEIISDFHLGLKQGYNRFSLLATDIGAYGIDKKNTLSNLIENMINSTEIENYSIILNQMEPFYLTERISELEKIFASGKIEKLMCPVQSGSNRILELMGREYTVEEWRSSMLKIHKKFPNIRIDTHFIVGFPTETDDDFSETLHLLYLFSSWRNRVAV